MENGAGSDRSLLVAELTQIRELARQMEAHLDQPCPIEFCKPLAEKILSSIDKSICMAKKSDSEGQQQQQQLAGTDSPRSATESPHSENSNQAFRDYDRKEMSKKRKTLPRWTSQIKVCPGEGVEGPLDDGHSWRKYGQKDILGATYPRGYYRCTHRNTQGCLATKQVQRSDENPSVFDVTYHGTHTCHQRSQSVPKSASRERELKQNKPNSQEHSQQQQDQNLLLTFQRDLKVITQGLGSEAQDKSSLSFSFPSTPVSGVKAEDLFFSSPSALDNGFTGSFSPSFLSQTSASNYFSVSPCRMSYHGGGFNLQTAESDLIEIMSAATSDTNSPLMDLDFMLEPVEFDPKFQLDVSSFFS
ncbi:probable WRKY transcription factor 41 [Phoenix dactylifera]|uniref:Probable WRKY transcription factor 41 n=1 Tax=Phoenix dactylifera TaxID=42345 RepID=A0A8B7BFP9_PHODC|nr:probable WRKY transcription factor 41 [Phoenix dactylifera]